MIFFLIPNVRKFSISQVCRAKLAWAMPWRENLHGVNIRSHAACMIYEPRIVTKIFDKPNEQSQACLGYAMARKFARSE